MNPAIPVFFSTRALAAAAAAVVVLAVLPTAGALDLDPAPVVLTSSTTLVPGAAEQPVTLTATNLGQEETLAAVASTAAPDRDIVGVVVTAGSYDAASDRWMLELGAGQSATMQFTMR